MDPFSQSFDLGSDTLERIVVQANDNKKEENVFEKENEQINSTEDLDFSVVLSDDSPTGGPCALRKKTQREKFRQCATRHKSKRTLLETTEIRRKNIIDEKAEINQLLEGLSGYMGDTQFSPHIPNKPILQTVKETTNVQTIEKSDSSLEFVEPPKNITSDNKIDLLILHNKNDDCEDLFDSDNVSFISGINDNHIESAKKELIQSKDLSGSIFSSDNERSFLDRSLRWDEDSSHLPDITESSTKNNNESDIRLSVDPRTNLKLLHNWNLPKSIYDAYQKKGIEEMFDWQCECLNNVKVGCNNYLLHIIIA